MQSKPAVIFVRTTKETKRKVERMAKRRRRSVSNYVDGILEELTLDQNIKKNS